MILLLVLFMSIEFSTGQRVLTPIRTEGPDVGLSIVPGMTLTHDQYLELGMLNIFVELKIKTSYPI